MRFLFSVVVAALNSEKTLGQTLSSLFSNVVSAGEFEVIVVDNGSEDRTVEVAKKYPVKLFSCAKRGQGAARNVGVSEASGEVICFTDSDIVVPRNWLETILGFFGSHPLADGVGGPVLAPLNGHLNSLQKLEGEVYARTHYFPAGMVKSTFGDPVGSLYSANCAYRRDVFVSFGGFDESVLDAVDIDLCWRLILKGKCLMFNPEMKVVHLGVPWSLRGVFRQQFRWGKSRGILNMRYPRARFVNTGLRTKIFQYYFPAVFFVQILYSKGKTKSMLQLFEKCAFTCGCISAYLRAWLNMKPSLYKSGDGD